MIRRARLEPLIAALALTAWTAACGDSATNPDFIPRAPFTAMVTFVVLNIVEDVGRVDITVNGKNMEPMVGTFNSDSTDRVTMRIPAGDSINAFARAFQGDSVILYIGEAYFNVRSNNPQDVSIPLKFKGAHVPTN